MPRNDFERSAAGGLTLADDRRRTRKQSAKDREAARRALTAEADAAAKALAAEERAASKAAAAARTPKGGWHEPVSGRSWREFKLRPHKATTATLAGAYPFLAGLGLGARGIYIGDDSYSGAAFCYDAHELYARQIISNTNIICAGNIGWGKSTTVKAVAKRLMAFGYRVFVPGDPKDEWRGLAQWCGGQFIQLGPGLLARLNPLDGGVKPADLSDADWHKTLPARRLVLLRTLVETASPKLVPLDPEAEAALSLALAAAVGRCGVPTLSDVTHELAHLDEHACREQGFNPLRLAEHAEPIHASLMSLIRGELAGLFDGQSTVRFDPALPMIAIGSAALGEDDRLQSLVMTCSSAWVASTYGQAEYGKRLVIYDESHRILGLPSQLRRLNSDIRLSRHYGISNIIVMHALSDVDKIGDTGTKEAALARGLVSMCDTRIILRQAPGEMARTRADLALTDVETAEIGNLAKGEALWKIGRDHAYVVRTRRTPLEARLFDTDHRMHHNPTGEHR